MDASGLGLRGYSLFSSRSWNYQLPENILAYITINHLEFLAFLIKLIFLEFENKLTREYLLV